MSSVVVCPEFGRVERCGLWALPTELLLEISHYFRDYREIAQLLQINKRWNKTIRENGIGIDLRDCEWPSDRWLKAALCISQCFSRISSLTLYRCNLSDDALLVLCRSRALTHLRVIEVKDCRNLKSLALSTVLILLHGSRQTTATHSIAETTALKSESTSVRRTVRSLSISRCPGLGFVERMNSQPPFAHLQCLCLRSCVNLNLLRQFPMCEPLVFDKLFTAERFPNLQVLTLTNEILHTFSLNFVLAMPKLTHLFLGGSKLITATPKKSEDKSVIWPDFVEHYNDESVSEDTGTVLTSDKSNGSQPTAGSLAFFVLSAFLRKNPRATVELTFCSEVLVNSLSARFNGTDASPAIASDQTSKLKGGYRVFTFLDAFNERMHAVATGGMQRDSDHISPFSSWLSENVPVADESKALFRQALGCALECQDSFGRCPLHISCAIERESRILKSLAAVKQKLRTATVAPVMLSPVKDKPDIEFADASTYTCFPMADTLDDDDSLDGVRMLSAAATLTGDDSQSDLKQDESKRELLCGSSSIVVNSSASGTRLMDDASVVDGISDALLAKKRDAAAGFALDFLYFGSTPDLTTKKRTTPLFAAARTNSSKCAECLLRFGADAFRKYGSIETCVEICCLRGNLQVMEVFLRRVPLSQLNDCSRFSNAWTPTHCACVGGNVPLLRRLIAAHCVADAVNYFGQTALHICAKRDRVECAKLLSDVFPLESLRIRDKYGQTAADICKQHDSCRVLKLIAVKSVMASASTGSEPQKADDILKKYPRKKKKKEPGRSDSALSWRKL